MITIRLRRDTSDKWELANPVLADGEPGYENDTGKFKIGNGSARWLDLNYFLQDDGVSDSSVAHEALAAVQAHIDSLQPHAVYDDGPSLFLLYQNAKV